MTTNTITGKDTLTINNNVFNDFAFGDVSTVKYNNKRVETKTGKNRNTIFADNASGANAEVALRLIKGSSDDIFLQTILAQQDADFASSVLMTGTFVKRLGDGQGNASSEVYALQGGMIEKYIDSKSSSEGDVEQGVSVYNMMFAYAVRGNQ
jgi:hypothetical protein